MILGPSVPSGDRDAWQPGEPEFQHRFLTSGSAHVEQPPTRHVFDVSSLLGSRFHICPQAPSLWIFFGFRVRTDPCMFL